VCPETDKTFADQYTKLCISICSPGSFSNNKTRACVAAINCSDDLVGNPLNLQCIDFNDCPAGYYVDLVTKMCVRRCPDLYYANLDTRICVKNCPWIPPEYFTYKL
jgi:hypothetical protein